MEFLLDSFYGLKKFTRSVLRVFMSNIETTGELKETNARLNVEWEIPNVFTLSDDVNRLCHSSVFYFMDAAWFLRFCPNGEKEYDSEGYVSFFLMRNDSGIPKSVTYKLSLKTASGLTEAISHGNHLFDSKKGWGVAKYMKRSSFLEKKSKFAPAGVLTVTCCLRHDETHVVRNSLLSRIFSLSASMKKILTEGVGSNVVLRAQETEFAAHKMILESRSPVFAAMFSHGMQEERTGVVKIKDIGADALRSTLHYMYSGDVDRLDNKNVFQVYQAADKYDLKELKDMCREFMQKKLSIDYVCDIIKFAHFYEEDELGRVARKYFNVHAKKIVKSDCWKNFYRENQELAMELLAAVIDPSSNEQMSDSGRQQIPDCGRNKMPDCGRQKLSLNSAVY